MNMQDTGVLTSAEIRDALQSRGLPVPDDLDELCQKLDASRNGTVNQNEFIAATAPAPSPTRDVGLFRAAFHMLDGDKDGVITDKDIECFLMPSPNRAALAR